MNVGFQSSCAELVGQELTSATFLLFDPSDEPGPAIRKAVSLGLGTHALTLRALTDTSELAVELKPLTIPTDGDFPDCYRIEGASEKAPLNAYVGQRVYNCWFLTNESGYSDGFMISFGHNHAVLFIAMNNEVTILDASGEACS